MSSRESSLSGFLLILFLSSLLFSAILAGLASQGRWTRALVPGFLVCSLLLGLGIAGSCFLNGSTIHLDYSSHLPFALGLSIDKLSGFFLVLICGLGIPVALFSASYAEHYTRASWKWYWRLLPLFIFSMVLVIVSSTVFVFMAGWELMTLLSGGLIVIEGDSPDRRRGLFIYLAMMHAGAAAVFGAFLLFVPGAPSLTFEAIRAASHGFSPQMRTAVFLLAFAGFGAKAGIIPLHLWLPKAHPIAPSPVSALMSGVACTSSCSRAMIM